MCTHAGRISWRLIRPSVELDESQAKTLLRSLEAFEAVRTSGDGSFTVDLSEDQPLIVRNMLSGSRLELPIFEAAELDAPVVRLSAHEPRTVVAGEPQKMVRVGGGWLSSIMLYFSIGPHVDRMMDR